MGLNLSMLGRWDVTAGGMVVRFRSDKVRALLAYLAVEQHRAHPRASLAALLWPEQPQDTALRNLSQTLFRLREAIGDNEAAPPFLLITHHTVQWNASSAAQLDVTTFRRLAQATETAAWAAAAPLYGGLFLPGFCIPACEDFDDWLTVTREQLERSALDVFDKLAQSHLAARLYTAADAAARRQLLLDPWRESAHRQLMLALAGAGQRGAALAQYASCHRILADELGIAPEAATTALYEQIRTGALDTQPRQRADQEAQQHDAGGPIARFARQDWGDAPDLSQLYGRHVDLDRLASWLIADRCRLIALIGMGGLGKTMLAVHLTQAVAEHFDVVIWRSLVNAPPFEELLRDWLHVLMPDHPVELPASLDAQFHLLLEHLRQRRCLLILDNFETLLAEAVSSAAMGTVRPDYAAFGQLLRRVGQGRHGSSLLLTSREQPAEVARLAGVHGTVRTYYLAGLDQHAGAALLAAHGLALPADHAVAVVDQYSGNPLALELVADTIRELYAGDATAFLAEGTPVFADIRIVLDQQFARLSDVERAVVFWLAIEREPLTMQVLAEDLVVRGAGTQRELLEALGALKQRSLLQQHGTAFTLQNVLMEYTTSRLTEAMCAVVEAAHGGCVTGAQLAASALNTYPLRQTAAKEFVRQIQERLLLQPVANRLLAQFGRQRLAERLGGLLDALRAEGARTPGYAAGNILNLLLAIGADVQGMDFGGLCVWQADLRGVALPMVSFAQADLTGSVFTDAFRAATAVAWSPDGQLLAVSAADGAISVWRAGTWQQDGVFSGSTAAVGSISFSPDGRFLASGSDDETVRLWHVASGRIHRTLHGHAARIQAVAFSPDGCELASAGNDQAVRIWDLETGHVRRTLHDHHAVVEALAVSPDGAVLASGSWDHSVRIWEQASGRCLRILHGHTHVVKAVAFSADGAVLASGSWDHSVRIWEQASGRLLHVLHGHSQPVACVAFSPDGALLASSGDEAVIYVWETRTGRLVRQLSGHAGWIRSVAFSPDGTMLASGSWDQTVRIWDTRTGHALRTLHGYANRVTALAYTPDGTTLASGGENGTICVWHSPTGAVLDRLHGHSALIRSLAFSPDGAMLASASWDTTVRLWDLHTRRLRHILRDHQQSVTTVAFSPDGRWLASAGNDHTIRVWDVQTHQAIAILHEHTDFVQSVAFGSDSQSLVSAGNDHTIRVWDTSSAQVRHTLRGHSHVVRAVAVSPDGKTLASGSWDRTVRLWDLRTGRLQHILHGHENSVHTLAFSPDRRLLASAGYDQTVRVWDVRTGQVLHILRGHTAIVGAVVFHPNGPILASGSDDETIKQWDVRTGACVTTLRAAGPYSEMNIAGATGITPAQHAALLALGAVVDARAGHATRPEVPPDRPRGDGALRST